MKFTKNLHLTQYQTNDTLSWRDRYNTDMRTIDAATSSTSAYVEDLVENMDKYNEYIENEIERLDTADDEQMKATASVLAYTQREALTREEEDNKLRAEIQITTSSVMNSTVELINNLTENLTEEMTSMRKDVDKNSLHNVQDDARLDALEELTGNYGQISAQIQSNTSSISAMKLRLSKAEEQIIDQGTVIGEIQTEQATADMRLESLENTTSAHADAISDINDLLTSYQPTVETVSILNGKMKVVEDTVHDQEGEISEIRTLAQQANQIAESASSTAEQASTVATGLQTTVDGMDGRINTATATANDAINAATTASTKADTATATANDAINAATTALGDAEAASTKADTAQATADSVNTRVPFTFIKRGSPTDYHMLVAPTSDSNTESEALLFTANTINNISLLKMNGYGASYVMTNKHAQFETTVADNPGNIDMGKWTSITIKCNNATIRRLFFLGKTAVLENASGYLFAVVISVGTDVIKFRAVNHTSTNDVFNYNTPVTVHFVV